ncbi:MAG: hypothetical protein R6U95_10525 [Bacteroidales bacterium]
MIVAVIDLGTNTFNLLICEVSHSSFTQLFHTKKVPKLGNESFYTGEFPPEAIERGILALHDLQAYIQQYNCDSVFAFGTAAIRCATNRQTFIDAVEREFGYTVSVISGDQEAEYVFLGNKLAYDWGMQTVLILDIGGGSNECILCEGGNLVWKKSFENGMQRIRSAFDCSYPLHTEEKKAIQTFLQESFKDLSQIIQSYTVDVLVGSSGPFDTFRDICLAKQGKEDYQKNYYEFRKDELHKLFAELLELNLNQSIAVPGMDPARAEFMPVAVLVTQHVAQISSVSRVVQSNFSLKEGVISTLIS